MLRQSVAATCLIFAACGAVEQAPTTGAGGKAELTSCAERKAAWKCELCITGWGLVYSAGTEWYSTWSKIKQRISTVRDYCENEGVVSAILSASTAPLGMEKGACIAEKTICSGACADSGVSQCYYLTQETKDQVNNCLTGVLNASQLTQEGISRLTPEGLFELVKDLPDCL
ncbi:MAG: hypothetical protein H6707_21730 [Deltaproteobacteria bacterium]|nr:hypothetical protein [Deltaproteobacteria bacterium]